MILRRFMKHFTDQNWFAVGLDVIVVIVGIFLGLQVQAWNEARLERAEEQGYLARIERELTKSITINESLIQTSLAAENYFDIIMNSINTCTIEEANKHKIATGLYSLSNTIPASYIHSVVDELISTGKFHVIQNVQLRGAFYEYMENFAVADNVADQTRNRVFPHVTFIEKQIVYHFKDRGNLDRIFTGDEIIIDIDKFCKKEGNLEAISAISTFRKSVRATASRAIVRQNILKEMVEAELDKFQ